MKKWCLRIFIWRYKGICLLYSPHMLRVLYDFGRIIKCEWVFSTHVESVTVLERTDK